jgi:hypothetical protein
MAKLFEIVTAATELLQTVDLNAYPKPMKSLDSPAAIVTIGPATVESTMGGDSKDRRLHINLFVTDGPEGIENLYEYLDDEGDKSLIRLFGSDPTLGGLVDYATLTDWEPPDLATVGQGEFLHVEVFVNLGIS